MGTKPRLLVFEHWGIGDLALATPFIAAATEVYDVTVVAKPFAASFQKRFWPNAQLQKLAAPWTNFVGKYHFYRWPWRELLKSLRRLRIVEATHAVSGRHDPRDHFLMFLSGAKHRIGFGRAGSGLFLTQNLSPYPLHRYDAWRKIAEMVNVDLPSLTRASVTHTRKGPLIIHSGAAQPVRVWPIERFAELANRLRAVGRDVRIACDKSQIGEWRKLNETPAVPDDVDSLVDLFDEASAFIGNDSGPGHVAALCGVPTFTIFGPQLPSSFAPLHPAAEWIDGKPCIYKPCFDSCRYPAPYCILNISKGEVINRVERFLRDK